MTGCAVNVQSRPTPTMWVGAVLLIDRRYLATEGDAAIVTEGDEQIFVSDQVGETMKSEAGTTIKSESGSDILPE